MDAEIVGYLATACGVVFIVVSAVTVLLILKMNRDDRKFERLLVEQRKLEFRLLSETRTQDDQQHAGSGAS